MNPALTIFGKTRTASAFDLHLAAAGFCATSCCKARRESLTKSADAVLAKSKVTAVNSSGMKMYLNDLMVCRLVVLNEWEFVVSAAMRLWDFGAMFVSEFGPKKSASRLKEADSLNLSERLLAF